MDYIFAMRITYGKSWQDKIDPAFDSVTKAYAGFLENYEEMPNGGIRLNEDRKEAVLNNPGCHSIYVEDKRLFKIVF